MEPSDLHKSILPWLGKTGKMLHIYMVEKFKQHNLELTFEQFIILRVLSEKDGQPQQDLADATKRHKASLTRIIGTMEKKNLVARIPDQTDGRINRIFLTTQGGKYLQSTMPVLAEAMLDVQKSLKQEEIEQFIAITKKVQKNLRV